MVCLLVLCGRSLHSPPAAANSARLIDPSPSVSILCISAAALCFAAAIASSSSLSNDPLPSQPNRSKSLCFSHCLAPSLVLSHLPCLTVSLSLSYCLTCPVSLSRFLSRTVTLAPPRAVAAETNGPTIQSQTRSRMHNHRHAVGPPLVVELASLHYQRRLPCSKHRQLHQHTL